MRHIPEEELHAYLDQALSRSQCVEIESHLAGCVVCRAERDAIAAVRDRTTDLLTAIAPRRVRPPSFQDLTARHHERTDRRRRWMANGLWAASIAAALGLGWFAHELSSNGPGVPGSLPLADANPPAATAVAESSLSAEPRIVRPSARRPARAVVPVAVATPDTAALSAAVPELALAVPSPEPARLELTTQSLQPSGAPAFAGLWRTVSWDGVRADSTRWVPHVEGLPVVEVQMQQGAGGRRPLMVVAQQLSSGQMIRTIAGPVADVSDLLSHQPGQSVTAELQDIAGGAQPARSYDTLRPGDDLLAILGPVSPDSLRAFLLKVR